MPLTRTQPETTARGKVWTQLVTFNFPAPGWCQLMIREREGIIYLDHGRVYAVPTKDEDDGA